VFSWGEGRMPPPFKENFIAFEHNNHMLRNNLTQAKTLCHNAKENLTKKSSVAFRRISCLSVLYCIIFKKEKIGFNGKNRITWFTWFTCLAHKFQLIIK
jgi:hypothetical protein